MDDTSSFDFSCFEFAPVIDLPSDYEIYDFSQGYDPDRTRRSPYGIGRYNEKRPGMYTTTLFSNQEGGLRDIHMGIDIAAPEGTPVRSFYDGKIYLAAVNPAPGDYGGTLITQHQLGNRWIWALYGHLSHESVARAKGAGLGNEIRRGDVIAWVGNKSENGGWNPHLHFQLSWARPETCDMPGAVRERDRKKALLTYPDPRFVLGPLY